VVLPSVEQQGTVSVFGKDLVFDRTGRLGTPYASARIILTIL